MAARTIASPELMEATAVHRLSHVLDKRRDPAAPSRSHVYDLRDQGRLEIFYVGRTGYLRESWEEIVMRIDREDREAGKAMGGPSVHARTRAKRERELAAAE